MKLRYLLSVFALGLSACNPAGGGLQGADMKGPDAAADPLDGAMMAACVPAGATPRVLLDQPPLEPEQLAIEGTTLYFGARTASLPNPAGALYRMPTSGGKPELFADKDFVSGSIAVNADSVIYRKAVVTPVGMGATIDYPNVLLRSKRDGSVLSLDNPPGHNYVDSLVVTPGSILWGSRGTMGPRSLSRWDVAKKSAAVLATVTNYSAMFSDDTDLFHARFVGSEVVFEAIPLGGGAPRELKRFLYDPPNPAILLGLSDGRLYFSADPKSGMVETMPTSGGPSTALVTISGGVVSRPFHIDDTHVYWTEQLNQQRLIRLKKAGGTPETFIDQAGQYVQAVTTDACNVYWTVVNPPRIMVRSR